MAKVLIVDPDNNITSLLSGAFESEGYQADVAIDSMDALTLNIRDYSLIVSEVDFDELDGFEMMDRARSIPGCENIAVILCTNRDGESDIIRGLNSGADDYIVKPFSLRETMARARSVMRRHGQSQSPAPAREYATEFNGMSLSAEHCMALCDGQKIPLSKTEFQILSLLFTNRNRLFRRDEIFESVWPGESDVSARTVDVNISRLRKKLGERGQHIVNRTGMGYGFME